jgi:hypothetical protein
VIIEAIVSFFGQSIRAVVGLIPSWSPPTEALASTSSSFGSMAAKGNGYFPVAILGVCLVLIFGLKLALLLWRLVIFVYGILPFKAT